jgi:hypothetical protein
MRRDPRQEQFARCDAANGAATPSERRRNGKTSKANATRALNGGLICDTDQTGFAGGCAAAAWVGPAGGGLGGVAGAVLAGAGGSDRGKLYSLRTDII